MTNRSLADLIRREALADEPPFTMTSAPAVAAGRRAVGRRRLVGSAVGAVVSVGVIAAALTLNPDETPEGVVAPPAAQEVLDTFDPDTFASIIDAEVRQAAAGAIPAAVEPRIEPTLDGYTRLRPKDYAYTDSWTAWYDLSPTDQVMVILQRDQSANEGSARRYCNERLSDDAERCSVGTLADGSITIEQVGKMVRTGSGGFDSPRTGDAPDSWWFVRQVLNRRGNGFGVIAREYVKAPSLAEADRRWSLTSTQLTQVAGSPRLVYEMPAAEKECDPTFLLSRRDDGFARVACEDSRAEG